MDALKIYRAKKRKYLIRFGIPFIVALLLIGIGLYMFFANVGGHRGPNYWGRYWSLTDFMTDPFSFPAGLIIDTGLLILVCTVPLFIWLFKKAKREYENALAQEQRQKAANEARRKLIEMVSKGTWEFPVKALYEQCSAQGIVDSDTAFSRKKIENAAKKIMLEEGIPEEIQGVYLQNAVKYFDVENARVISRMKEEDVSWKTSLHTAKPSDEEQEMLRSANLAQTLYGTQKREALLKAALEEAQLKLAQYDGSGFTPHLQREKDWAIHGGIAEGIAGPAAGVATALNVMKENEKIREQNSQMLTAAAMINIHRSQKAERYKNEVSRLSDELRKLPEKVVFDDITIPELFSAFTLSLKEISRVSEHDEGCMKVRLTLRQEKSLHLDIPDGVKIVLDGAVSGKVYTTKEQTVSQCPGGVEVGEFIAPLEIYGIPYLNSLAEGETGTTYELTALCSHFYGDIGANYTCRLNRSQNLWLMEK